MSKKYAFVFRDCTHHLKGLTDEVKETILDHVKGREYKRLKRQAEAGVIDAKTYQELKDDVRAIPFMSRLVGDYIASEAGSKVFLRTLIVGGDDREAWPDELIHELAHADEGDSVNQAMERLREDAFPKAKTPPTSTASAGETSGAASCSANPST